MVWRIEIGSISKKLMKRITIIAGHYGSGKSEVSVNLALNHKVDYIVDLDIINPYFRSRALNELFEEQGLLFKIRPINWLIPVSQISAIDAFNKTYLR